MVSKQKQIRSMTGLGIGEFRSEDINCIVEIRSVNNRFLEISCRLPQSLSQYEQAVKECIRKYVERGKLYVNVTLQNGKTEGPDLRVIPEKAASVRVLLENLRTASGVNEKLTLDHFLRFSEIFEPPENGQTDETIWEVIQSALSKSLISLNDMRLQEGNALVKDLNERLIQLDKDIKTVEKIAKTSVLEKHEKFTERIASLIGHYSLNEDRLYTEVAMLSDKLDVTEECVRLKSHNQLFRNTLKAGESVGKKLTFLLQEMNREVNTISSKASNVDISHQAVSMKEEIEKMREQVQNLE